jgi:putative ABC transport system substrate-binding protein
MNRRELLLLLGGAMGAARGLRAQQKAMPVIGFLGTASANAPLLAAFRQGLSEAGYVVGQNVAIEYRWAEGYYDRLPALAAELVGRKVDVIATTGGSVSALAAKSATATIPIVFAGVSDPVGDGLVASLARPGSNLTGFSLLNAELTPKRLELLSELVPQARVIALLVNPNNPQTEGVIRDVQEAGRAKGVQLDILKAGTESEIDAAFATLVQLQAGALVVQADSFFGSRRAQLLALASRHAVPAIYSLREYTAAGALISYGPSLTAMFRQAGIYTGRILKGAKPADLPAQQPTTFELVVNLNTAKALGITVPPSILARADEVIE